MKLHIITLIIVLFFSSFCYGQRIDSTDFNHFVVTHKKLGKIRYHMYNKHLDKKLPVLLFLQGSMDLPLIALNGKDSRFYTFNREILNYADQYHIILISKPDRNFCDSVLLENNEFKIEKRAIYNQSNTQEWRVGVANLVLKKILKFNFISKEKVIVIGYSEGGQVVPELACKNNKITHLVSINGAGLNHFYDSVINERMKAYAGFKSKENAQQKIDSLFTLYENIYKNEESLTQFHDDESYKRWASYTRKDPVEYLKKINIPILVIASGDDENSPILGLDYIKIEFLRLRKQNLSYRVYPNSDHSFNEKDLEDKTTNKRKEMYQYVFQWLAETK